jgi:hypothetical protein
MLHRDWPSLLMALQVALSLLRSSDVKAIAIRSPREVRPTSGIEWWSARSAASKAPPDQPEAEDGHDRADYEPLRMPGHRTAAEDAGALEGPHDSEQEQEDSPNQSDPMHLVHIDLSLHRMLLAFPLAMLVRHHEQIASPASNALGV